MRLMLEQLENSLDTGAYYLSLFMALTIPDIAGAMDSEKGIASGLQFADWFDRWVRPRHAENNNKAMAAYGVTPAYSENPLDGRACYLFRCSLLHQGRTVHPKSKFSRIMFVEPRPNFSMHYSTFNDALTIDVNEFCREIIQGARMWLDAVENSERYALNYANFAKRHPDGLAPYIVGIPIIG